MTLLPPPGQIFTGGGCNSQVTQKPAAICSRARDAQNSFEII
jgi:hypothetical protein